MNPDRMRSFRRAALSLLVLAVLWEIAETKRQGHYIFGIQTNASETHPVPAGLAESSVIRWKFSDIVIWLKSWR